MIKECAITKEMFDERSLKKLEGGEDVQWFFYNYTNMRLRKGSVTLSEVLQCIEEFKQWESLYRQTYEAYSDEYALEYCRKINKDISVLDIDDMIGLLQGIEEQNPDCNAQIPVEGHYFLDRQGILVIRMMIGVNVNRISQLAVCLK